MKDHPSRRPIEVVFVMVFALVFLLSGLLSVATSDAYRMGLVSALVIPLVLLYGVQLDAVFAGFAALSAAILISAVTNRSSVRDFVLFMRIPAFAFLMYYLATSVMNRDNLRQILRVCVGIAVIQLPVVLVQNLLIGGIDSDFGTFNIQSDYAMAFFAIAMTIVTLFGLQRDEIIDRKARLPIAWWLTLTVFTCNAQMTKFIMFVVWGSYLVARFRLRRVLIVLLVALTIAGALLAMVQLGLTSENPLSFLSRLPGGKDLASGQSAASTGYLEGGYDRSGGIRYFMSQPVNWFGDGPSKYYDVFTQVSTRGNYGHFFTFYSEVGLIAWLLSMIVLFSIAFVSDWSLRWSVVGMDLFLAISMLSLTSQVMNDVSVMLIYSIAARSRWILSSAASEDGQASS